MRCPALFLWRIVPHRMYTNIFFFVIIVSIYTLVEAPAGGVPGPAGSLGLVVVGCVLHWAIVSTSFRVFERHYFDGDRPPGGFASAHDRVITRCTAGAVVLYAALLYGSGLKTHIARLTLLGSSELMSSIAGLLPCAVLLLIGWNASYPSYCRYYGAVPARAGYLLSHTRMNAAFVLPWFIFMLVFDLVALLPASLSGPLRTDTTASLLLYAGVLALLGVFYPWLLVRLWNCRVLPSGPVRSRIEGFCRQHGFSCREVLLWDLFGGKLITAGVLGLVRQFRYLLISPALANMLDGDELDGVVAHEIGHVHYRHLVFYVLFILGYAVFSFFAFNALTMAVLSQEQLFDLLITPAGDLNPLVYLLPLGVIVLCLVLYFRYLFGYFSRAFERQSDAHAVRLTGSAGPIVRSLEKIALLGSHNRHAPNWHHHSIHDRVTFLERCERDPSAIALHNRRVFASIALYVLLLAGAVLYGFGATQQDTSEAQLKVMTRMARNKLQQDPHNARLHFLLGNLYYEQEKLREAITSYQASIRLEPDNAEALNNLAWLYVTAADNRFHRPGKALELALQAARLAPLPHILDTLAECYFALGRYREAIETIRAAIALGPEDSAYYEKQLQKFEKHLKQDRYKKWREDASGQFRAIGYASGRFFCGETFRYADL